MLFTRYDPDGTTPGRGRFVSAIAWEASGTTSGRNATCHRRCPPAEKLITDSMQRSTVKTVMGA
jgi:hypothetical protein